MKILAWLILALLASFIGLVIGVELSSLIEEPLIPPYTVEMVR